MSKRHLIFLVLILIALVAVAQIPIDTQAKKTQTAIAGRNVNMVTGTEPVTGDPYLQRQNEPSIAVSTANPQHLLAAVNDYRTVDIADSEGELSGEMPGTAYAKDAWIGILKSFDGGESWVNELLPLLPQDTGPPDYTQLPQYTTAADPVVRAGVDGFFYVSGIAFIRDGSKNLLESAIFVATYRDVNDPQKEDAIEHLGTKIIDFGGPPLFIDKPWITAGLDNSLYLAYSVFLKDGGAIVDSEIRFWKYTDTAGWIGPKTLDSYSGDGVYIAAKKETRGIYQGAAMAVSPVDGSVHVAWRQFGNGKRQHAIKTIKIAQGDPNSISNPVEVAIIDPFDQGTTTTEDYYAGVTGFRTNSYPSMAIDGSGEIYIAWSDRQGKTNSKIVVSSSSDGVKWSHGKAVDNQGKGHQFMPSMTFGEGRLVVVWYDQRADASQQFNPYIYDDMGYFFHTIDVRAAFAEPGKNLKFDPSMQISRYMYVYDENTGSLSQGQFNPPNFPLFMGGTAPFIGDYIDVCPSPMFIKDISGQWVFNTEPANRSPVFHVVWTDNRDVRLPVEPYYSWKLYAAPGTEGCEPGYNRGMRNQNVYTSRISHGLVAGSQVNRKKRLYTKDVQVFIVQVNNTTDGICTFRLDISEEPDLVEPEYASFSRYDRDADELFVSVAPYSSATRPVYAKSTQTDCTIRVDIVEVDGMGGSPFAGGSSSFVELSIAGDSAEAKETFDPKIKLSGIVDWNKSWGDWEKLNPNIFNPNIFNPNIFNPNIFNTDIVNPNIFNPNIFNPNIFNPNIFNPNIFNPNIFNPNIFNPNIFNPNIFNPNIFNPNIFNPNIFNASLAGSETYDVVWTVTNEGTATASYVFKVFAKETLPEGIYAQLLIYRNHTSPITSLNPSDEQCILGNQIHQELVANIVNPNIFNPNIFNTGILSPNIFNASIENVTFSVEPGEYIDVMLRLVKPDMNQVILTQQGLPFDLESFANKVGGAVNAQVPNTDEPEVVRADATKLVIGTVTLPPGEETVQYGPGGAGAYIDAFGGYGSYSWLITDGILPPGLNFGTATSNGVVRAHITGTPTQKGTYWFIVRVDTPGDPNSDSVIPPDTDTQEFMITVYEYEAPQILNIETTSLPNGVTGNYYGTTLYASGGTLPYAWTKESGTLPTGLSLDEGGVISGRPTVEGTFNFTVKVTDSALSWDTQPLSITVNASQGFYYTISGTIYDEDDGSLLDGVVMRGLPNTPVTDEYGYYEDEVPAGWAGIVEPFKVDHVFFPDTRTYTNVSADYANQDYNDPDAPVPARIVITQQPGGGIGGQAWSVQPTVRIKNVAGLDIPSDNSTVVTLDLFDDPGNGTLSGTSVLQVVNGEALFTDLSIDRGGHGYTLEATSPGLIPDVSGPFNIEGFAFTSEDMEIAARKNHTATLLNNGLVLITGGENQILDGDYTGNPYNDSAENYSTATDEFSVEATQLHGQKSKHTATLLLNGKVLITGGEGYAYPYTPGDPIVTLDNQDVYTPGSGFYWHAVNPITETMIYPRKSHTATLITTGPDTGKVLIAGGAAGSNIAELYDPVSDNPLDGFFALISDSMEAERHDHTATMLSDGRILIVGGRDGEPLSANALASAEIYDPMTREFTSTGSMNQARVFHTATSLPDGKILISGGIGTSATGLDTAEVYDPATGTFSYTGSPMNAPRSEHAAIHLGGGRVLIVGDSLTVGSEIYYHSSGTFSPTGPLPSGLNLQGSGAIRFQGTGIRVLFAAGTDASNNPVKNAVIWYPLESGAPAPTLTSVDPTDGTNGDDALTVTVGGTNFVSGAAVELNFNGTNAVAADNVTFVSSTELEAVFDLTSVTTNLDLAWDVKITNPDYQSAILQNSFTIYDSTPPPPAYFVVSGNSTVEAGVPKELTITAYDAGGIKDTYYTGPKSLTFSGPNSAPDGTQPTVEGVPVGTPVAVNFINGVSEPESATLIPYQATPSVSVDVTDGTTDSFGHPDYDYDLTVTPGPTSGAESILSVFPGTNVYAGMTVDILINTYDQYQNSKLLWPPDGDIIVITITGTNPEVPEITGTGPIYTSYTPMIPGADEISGTINGEPIGKDSEGVSDGIIHMTINVGLPAQMVFTQQPSGGIGSQEWITQPIVEVKDSVGNTVTTDNSTVVTLSILDNPGNGTLSADLGNAELQVIDGVADFSLNFLNIDRGGHSYTLEATAIGLPSDVSEAFNIEGFSDTASTMDVPRIDHTATPLVNDKVLIAGGENPTNGFLDTALLYDPATEQFSSPITMNEVRGGHTATVLFNNKVLITGGGPCTQSAEIYDPDTNTFTPTGNMYIARKDHRATRLQDGRVLITGGSCQSSEQAEVYDPTTGIFSLTGAMIDDRYWHTATLLPNGKVLITGGTRYSSGVAQSSAELYDPATGQFSEIPGGMGEARHSQTAILLNNGTVLITGGDNGSGWVDTTEIYDPTTEIFSAAGSMLDPLACHQATLLWDGSVLITGAGLAQVYEPGSGFRLTGPVQQYRQNGAEAVLINGFVLVTGGGYDFGGNPVSTAEIWNPLNPFSSHIISGTITMDSTGVPGVLLDGLPGYPVTGSGGYYEAVFIDGWSGLVTPVKPGYTFDPTLTDYPVLTDNQVTNYSVVTAPPNQVELTGPATVEAGAVSGAFSLTSRDLLGIVSDVIGDTSFNLESTNSPTVTFYEDAGGTIPITYTTILTGQSSATFYYSDTEGGTTPTVTATCTSGPNNLGSGSHQISVIVVHAVSTPWTPWGPISGYTGTSYNYDTGDSTCSLGHPVEYRFDWGDGNFSTWSSSTNASYAWTSAGTYAVKAQARCSENHGIESSWSDSLTVTISAALEITTTTIPDGVRGEFYGPAAIEATGGVPPLSWDLAPGSDPLPDGLSLDPESGELSGTLNESGFFSFTIRVTDSAIQSDTKDLYLTVAEWVVLYDGPAGNLDSAIDIATDTSGSVYVTGYSTGNGTGYDWYTAKYDSSGLKLWDVRYDGGYGDDIPAAILVDAEGYIYVSGKSQVDETNWKIVTIKYRQYDETGTPITPWEQVWTSTYNGSGIGEDKPSDLAVDASGNVYVTGWSTEIGTFYDWFTAKYDGTTGSELWHQTYNVETVNGDDNASALALDSEGNIYVTGASASATDRDYLTIKYSGIDGQILWEQRYNNDSVNGPEGAKDIALHTDTLGDDYVYVTGFGEGADGTWDYITIKYDSQGNELWVKSYEGLGGDDEAYALAVNSTGTVSVTGYSVGDGTGYDYATIMYDSSGNTILTIWNPNYTPQGYSQDIWGAARINGPANGGDYAQDIAIDPTGGIYVTGYSEGISGSRDLFTAKFTNGIPDRNARFEPGVTIAPTLDYKSAVVIDPFGNFIVSGTSNASGDEDIVTVKYSQDFTGPYIMTTSLPDGFAGSYYSTAVWAFGGTGARIWSITDGSLPPDLSIDPSTGVISGTPTAVGTYNFQVTVTDGISNYQWLSITINEEPPSQVEITGPLSVDAGIVSGALTLFSQDGGGTPLNVLGDTVFDLSSNSAGTATFYSDSGGTNEITQVTIAGGTNSAVFYYKDTAVGDSTITATFSGGPNYLGLDSHVITVYPGAASQLAFVQQPGGGVADKAWGIQPIVEVQDTFGNIIDTDNTTEVLLEISANPGSGELAGEVGLTVVNGQAIFSGLEIYNPGSGYTLVAGAPNNPAVGPVFSTNFNITAPPSISNEEWIHLYNNDSVDGDDESNAVFADSFGNVYVTGYSRGFPTLKDFYTIKYDSAGNVEWKARYSNPGIVGDDEAVAITVDSKGQVYVTGSSMGETTELDIATIKYDSAGVQKWVTRFDEDLDDVPTDIAVDPSSGAVYITGSTIDLSGTNTNVLIQKYDIAGIHQWTVDNIGTAAGNDVGKAIAVDQNGYVYVTCKYFSGGNYSYYTTRYTSSGDFNWSRTYLAEAFKFHEPEDMILDPSEDYVYVTGTCETTANGYGWATVKYDADFGTPVWGGDGSVKYNSVGTQEDFGKHIALDSSGKIYVTGTHDQTGEKATAIVKYFSSGAWEWGRLYKGTDTTFDVPHGLVVDSTDKAIVVGTSQTPSTFEDFFAVKYNDSGDRLWVRRHDGPASNYDQAFGIAVDPDGNVFVTGTSINTDLNMDFATVKYTPDLEDWVVRYDGVQNQHDEGHAINVDSSGNIYVAGRTMETLTDYDYYVVKYNSAGTKQWDTTFDGGGNDTPVAIGVDSSGNVYVTGESFGGDSYQDFCTVKFNSAGTYQWDVTYDNGNRDYPIAMAVDSSGNTYVTGSTNIGSLSYYDIYTVKYDSSGVKDWEYTYGGGDNYNDGPSDLTMDSTGNVYVTGTTEIVSTGDVNIYLLKLSSSGSVTWERVYNITADVYARAVAVNDSSGDVYIAGNQYELTGSWWDYTTIKYDSSGAWQWSETYGTDDIRDDIQDIALDPSGNVYVTGYSSTGAMSRDFTTIKYDSSGSKLWDRRYDGPKGTTDMPFALAVDSSGYIYVTGSSFGHANTADYATVVYDTTGSEIWVARYHGLEGIDDSDFPNAISIFEDSPNNAVYVYVTGRSSDSSGGYGDIATIRYIFNLSIIE